MPPTRSRGEAGISTQTSAALTLGRGCRPLASVALPRAAAPRQPGATALAFPTPAQPRNGRTGVSAGWRAQGRGPGAEVRPPRWSGS